MNTIVVMGDIGAQLMLFYRTLRKLGVSQDLRIPDGLIIVNVGDVARMSNSPNLHSLKCLEIADELIKRNPGQWIQLLGNHESPFIGGPALPEWFQLPDFEESEKIVSKWWNEGTAQLSQIIETPETNIDTIVTHAGLTSGFMKDNGFLNDHRGMVKFLNSLNPNSSTDYKDIAKTGVVTFKDSPSVFTDCLWASTANELYPSWNNESMGFNQIHGHDIPLISWEDMIFREGITKKIEETLTLDPVKRHVNYNVPSGESIYGIDWVLKNTVHADSSTWEMKVFENSRLLIS